MYFTTLSDFTLPFRGLGGVVSFIFNIYVFSL